MQLIRGSSSSSLLPCLPRLRGRHGITLACNRRSAQPHALRLDLLTPLQPAIRVPSSAPVPSSLIGRCPTERAPTAHLPILLPPNTHSHNTPPSLNMDEATHPRFPLDSLLSLYHFSSVSLDSGAKLRAAASVCLNNSTAERWMRSLRSGRGMGR